MAIKIHVKNVADIQALFRLAAERAMNRVITEVASGTAPGNLSHMRDRKWKLQPGPYRRENPDYNGLASSLYLEVDTVSKKIFLKSHAPHFADVDQGSIEPWWIIKPKSPNKFLSWDKDPFQVAYKNPRSDKIVLDTTVRHDKIVGKDYTHDLKFLAEEYFQKELAALGLKAGQKKIPQKRQRRTGERFMQTRRR